MPRELKSEQVRDMSVEEIGEKLKEASEELFNLRFRNSMKQLENPLKIRQTRRDIARIKTILKEVELGLRKVAEHGKAK